jgi:hypothetical protein
MRTVLLLALGLAVHVDTTRAQCAGCGADYNRGDRASVERSDASAKADRADHGERGGGAVDRSDRGERGGGGLADRPDRPEPSEKRSLEGMTVTKAEARGQTIKDVSKEVVERGGRPFVVKSEGRSDSAAHQRGAIDIRSKDITSAERHEEAKTLSKELGKEHTVVVEEVHARAAGTQGPEAQVNTAYRDGVEGRTRVGEIKATATHTHAQPELPRELPKQ